MMITSCHNTLMELNQSKSNGIFGHRRIIIEELIQHPHSDTTYVSRQIITEESYGKY